VLATHSAYDAAHKEEASARYAANKEEIAVTHSVYVVSHKEEIAITKAAYVRRRLAIDLEFKLIRDLRSRFNSAIRGNYKAGSAVRDLGCTIGEWRAHMTARFYPHPVTGEEMTWDNRGVHGWHIDHIIPFASIDVTNREQLLTVLHYTNQQPMWAIDNLRKSDKLNWRK